MSSVKLGPKLWTTRFKIHKTTILLYVEPNQRISSIKQELLTALHEAFPTERLRGRDGMYTIPDAIQYVELGKLIEADGSSGIWERIDADEDDDGNISHKGKGRALSEKSGTKESTKTAQSVGLADGSIVAVRFTNPTSPEKSYEEADDKVWDVIFSNQQTSGDALDGFG